MSKKKSSTGSTMTLKDFHGGSIPSDLPLPSAPGVTVRPADRPRSASSIRNLDVRTPFFTNTTHIGRNFDEDERKPLGDSISGPRRTVIDEIITAPPVLVESRSDVGRFLGSSTSSNSKVYSSSSSSSRTYPNAWAVRKDPVGVPDAAPSPPYVGQNNVLKIAQASALEKVSSGRWQTKPVREQVDVEVIHQVESPTNLRPRASERDYSERMLVVQAERNLSMENTIQNVAKEARAGDRTSSLVLLGAKEKISSLSTSSGQPPNAERKSGIPGSQPPADASERPKLKLLPRTKPLEASELPSLEHKQEQKFQQPNDSSHLEKGNEVLGKVTHVKPGLAGGDEGGDRQVERPKLKSKPHSQPLEQAEESTERPRVTLFGGARPRELVLKERGVDDVNNGEVIRSPIKVKNDTSHSENTVSVHSNAVRHGERATNSNLDHRTGKSINRREQQGDAEKAEVQRDNWRNDKWKNKSDAQKQQETWCKPIIEQPKPSKTDASGLRHGKTASAVELAQAYSRSVSDPQQKVAQISSPYGVPGGTQIPFSRLTGSTTRQRVNGY